MPLEEPRRQAVITTLCNYGVGGAAALEASSGMVALAPTRAGRAGAGLLRRHLSRLVVVQREDGSLEAEVTYGR